MKEIPICYSMAFQHPTDKRVGTHNWCKHVLVWNEGQKITKIPGVAHDLMETICLEYKLEMSDLKLTYVDMSEVE